MIKKLLIFGVIALIIGMALVPAWTTKMAEDGFKEPDKTASPENVKKALKIKMYLYMYPEARKMAERAVIYFPESQEFPYFIYTAALSSEKSNAPLAAVHWYGYFIELFPKHEWANQAQNSYNKLKGVHTTDTKN
ncbi:MAG TPA: hypothetical protein DCZ94_01940 [Lentisphaeria bacterium]|nr:MAG: hypothetical protein A2X48_22660 [Lentisphaerae bacterium GWF2_49_21]HBC85694.1 hypothetical protein [Lentisphaeria bacterium]